MTCTIRQIDPTTGTSKTFEAATLEDALVLVAEIFDKHIIVLDDDTNATLHEQFPEMTGDVPYYRSIG